MSNALYLERVLEILCERLDKIDGKSDKFKEKELNEFYLYQYQCELMRLIKELDTNSLEELSNLATDSDNFSSDIHSLKKRIKYCRNPLERKNLQKQLNAAYKTMKKRSDRYE